MLKDRALMGSDTKEGMVFASACVSLFCLMLFPAISGHVLILGTRRTSDIRQTQLERQMRTSFFSCTLEFFRCLKEFSRT